MADANENDALRQDLDQLRQDFSTLRDDMKNQYQGQVRAGVDKARDSLGGVCSEVESRPYTCMAAAFGVGLLLGHFFRR